MWMRSFIFSIQSQGPDESSPERLQKLQCNVLTCPFDCCFANEDCIFQCDLLCNSWTCTAFLNVTACDYPVGGYSKVDATVAGRAVHWTWYSGLRHKGVKLHDVEYDETFEHYLNDSYKFPTRMAACRCLEYYAKSVLNKKMASRCEDVGSFFL